MKAGKAEVFKSVLSTFRNGNEMIYREANILPLLIGVAVLAKKIRPPTNLLLKFFRDFTRQGSRPHFAIGKDFVLDD